jgi:hypothetical protein
MVWVAAEHSATEAYGAMVDGNPTSRAVSGKLTSIDAYGSQVHARSWSYGGLCPFVSPVRTQLRDMEERPTANAREFPGLDVRRAGTCRRERQKYHLPGRSGTLRRIGADFQKWPCR